MFTWPSVFGGIVSGRIIHSPENKTREVEKNRGAKRRRSAATPLSNFNLAMWHVNFSTICGNFFSFFVALLFVFIVRRQKKKKKNQKVMPRSFNSAGFVAVRLILLPNFQF